MTGRARTWALVAAAVAVVALAVLLAAAGEGGPATVHDRAQEIASELRCPVCQNLSVADSPSRLAGEMRSDIADRLRAGQSEGQVKDYFVGRYGEWVLLEPTRRGLNLVPWLFPIVALLAGAAIWVVVLLRRPRPEGAT